MTEIHPGEILLEDFMKPLGLSARQLSSDLDVPPSRISEIVHGLRTVTADTAPRLGWYFGMEAGLGRSGAWLIRQTGTSTGHGEAACRAPGRPQRARRGRRRPDQATHQFGNLRIAIEG